MKVATFHTDDWTPQPFSIDPSRIQSVENTSNGCTIVMHDGTVFHPRESYEHVMKVWTSS